MKIRYMSDLHFEFHDTPPDAVEPIGEDVVVLAGDVHNGVRGILWAQGAFAQRPVVYVCRDDGREGRPELHRVDA